MRKTASQIADEVLLKCSTARKTASEEDTFPYPLELVRRMQYMTGIEKLKAMAEYRGLPVLGGAPNED